LNANGTPIARIDVFTPPGMYLFPSSTIAVDFSDPNELKPLSNTLRPATRHVVFIVYRPSIQNSALESLSTIGRSFRGSTSSGHFPRKLVHLSDVSAKQFHPTGLKYRF
jgi:hypothetical protein